MNPSPRHSKCGRSSNTSAITSSARVLPSHGTTRLYWFSTSQRPSRSWTRIIWTACRMSSGSKPAITTGLPYVFGMNSNGRAQRRDDRHVAAHDGEIGQALCLCPLERERGRGSGGLEADGEEDDLAVRV